MLDWFVALSRVSDALVEHFLPMNEQAKSLNGTYCHGAQPFLIGMLIFLAFSPSPALADSAGSARRLLQGGIKDNAPLHPSLKLVPGQGSSDTSTQLFGGASSYVAPLGAQMQQGLGGVMYAPGIPIPQLVPSVESRSGHTNPISSYTLQPVSGVLVAPGYEVRKSSDGSGVSQYSSIYSEPRAVTVKGVTTYVSGFEVLTQKVTLPPRTIGTGVAVFQPDYVIEKISAVTNSQQADTTTRFTGGSLSSSAPTAVSCGSGIVCWVPGYEVSVQSAQVSQEKLGGAWTAQVPGMPQLSTTPLALPNLRSSVEAVKPEALTATPKLLPGIKPELFPSDITWPQWYNRVAKAIYSRWQYYAVCPGQATVRATISRNRVMTCRVIDFTPIAAGERNTAAETDFRESALAAANGVSIFEIPEFPELAKEDIVSLDVVMRRSVDGPNGYSVASTKH